MPLHYLSNHGDLLCNTYHPLLPFRQSPDAAWRRAVGQCQHCAREHAGNSGSGMRETLFSLLKERCVYAFLQISVGWVLQDTLILHSHQTLPSVQSVTGPRGKHSYIYSISWAGRTQYSHFCMTTGQDLFSACWWKVGHSVEGRTRFRERKKSVRWGNLVLWSSEESIPLK